MAGSFIAMYVPPARPLAEATALMSIKSVNSSANWAVIW